MPRPITVIIPIFNGFEALETCLASVAAHTGATRVLLVDDASTDPRIAPLLDAIIARQPNFERLDNPRNLGFVGSVNRALATTPDDIVLLNSDTEVFPGWIEGLASAADSRDDIGIVCPLSDNATLLTLFGAVASEARPAAARIAEALVALAPDMVYPLPTGVGFCMFVKRDVVERIGAFDPIFDAGYGEENDFCMRAWRAGFATVCQPAVFVRHAGGVSFRDVDDLAGRRERNRALLAARWPQYEPWVSAFDAVDPRWALELRLVAHFAAPQRAVIVHAVHRWSDTGGVESYVQRLVRESARDYLHVVVVPTTGPGAPRVARCSATGAWLVRLPARADAALATLLEHPLLSPSAPLYERQLGRLLRLVQPLALHVHHMLGSFTLRHHVVAMEASVPLFWGLHDYFAICPNPALLKPTMQSCTKPRFDNSDAECVRCLGENVAAPPAFQREIARIDGEARLQQLRGAAIYATFLYAPSAALKERLRPAWADLADRIEVVPHHRYVRAAANSTPGADAAVATSTAAMAPAASASTQTAASTASLSAATASLSAAAATATPHASPAKRIVAHLGAFNRAKGADMFIALQRILRSEGRYEFWIIGLVAPEYASAVREEGMRETGLYVPARLPELLRDVDVVCCLSNADETFGFTVDEALAAGKRIVATRSRALLERHAAVPAIGFVDAGDHRGAAALIRRWTDASSAPLERIDVQFNVEPVIAAYARRAALRRAGVDASQTESGDAMPVLKAIVADAEAFRATTFAPLAEAAAGGFGNIVFAPWLERHRQQSLRGGTASSPDIAVVDWQALPAAATPSASWIAVVGTDDDVDRAAIADLATAANAGVQAIVLSDCIRAGNGEEYGSRFKPAYDAQSYAGGLADGGALYRSERLPLLRAAAQAASTLAAFQRTALARIVALDGRAAVDVSERLAVARDERRAWLSERPPRVVHRQSVALERMTVDVAWFVGADNEAINLSSVFGELLSMPAFGFLTLVFPEDSAHVAFDAFSHPRLRTLRRAPGAGAVLADIAAASRARVLAITSLRPDGPLIALADEAAASLAADASGVTAAIEEGATSLVERGVRFGAGGRSIASLVLEPMSQHRVERAVEGASDHLLYVAPDQLRALDAATFRLRSIVATCVALSAALRMTGRPIRCLAASWRPRMPPGATLTTRFDAGIAATDRDALLDSDWLARAASNRLDSVASRFPTTPAATPSPFFPAAIGCGKRRLRVVALPYDDWGSGNYRVRQPMRALEATGAIDVEILPPHDRGFAPTVAQLAWYEADVVLAHNPFHDYQIAALADIRRHARCRIVVGMDDLLHDLPPYNPYAQTQYPDLKARIKRVGTLADAWIFSTSALARAYEPVARERRVVPNALDPAAWPALSAHARPAGARPRVGWVGARQHGGDLELLREAYAATRERVQWVFMGMRPTFADADVEFHPMVPFARFPAALRALQLDIGLAPLVDNAFNRAKSAIKAIEYLAAGAHPICADIGVYDGLPVTLAAPTSAALRDALCAALDDATHNVDAAHNAVATRTVVARDGLPFLRDTAPLWLQALKGH